jgi:DNA-binding XRE family transcriptional regulator
MSENLANYVRMHRKRAALSLKELGMLLGFDETAILRHEKFQSMPSLTMALGYEIIFGIPTSELFIGLRESVAQGVEHRIGQFKAMLEEESGRGPRAASVARKLEWIYERPSFGVQTLGIPE